MFRNSKESLAKNTMKEIFNHNNGDRIYFNVPYKLKDEVKDMGCKWCNNKKQWYTLESILGEDWTIPLKNPKVEIIKSMIDKYNNEFKSSKVYLNVSYADKDEAKKLGARWCNDSKKWFIERSDTRSDHLCNIYGPL